MRIRMLLLSSLLAAIGGFHSSRPVTSVSDLRSYSGTTSAGGFLSISVNPVAHTLTYSNISEAHDGVVSFVENSDGIYEINDPEGILLAAYEIPNHGLLLEAANAGPDHDALALITAVPVRDISLSTWSSHGYNYMQFRANAGGLEVGSARIDAHGNLSTIAYWPFGELSQQGSAFHRGGFSGGSMQEDGSGTFLRVPHRDGDFDYVFGTPNGMFDIDTPNGTILGLKKAAYKEFDPSFAGTYKAFYYRKTGASVSVVDFGTGEPSLKIADRAGMLDFEGGMPGLGSATVRISAGGQLTVDDDHGNALLQATLVPVADAAYLHGTGEFQDPCFGLYTFRVATASFQQDAFVGFQDGEVLFSSFKAGRPWKTGTTYDYLYGVGLR